ncbi:MAG: MSMEG_0570 family nitrogen starvation response protein [Bacteroidota bacterium]
MPEVNLRVKWPDEHISDVYSPSTIVRQYFSSGDLMTVSDFVTKCTEALEHASKRVEEKFGYACTSARNSIHNVRQSAKDLKQDSLVEILEIS